MDISFFNYEYDDSQDENSEDLEVTYYLIYKVTEVSVLMDKLLLNDMFKEVVEACNGDIKGNEDVFYSHEDAINALNVLKERFSDTLWYLSVLRESILKSFPDVLETGNIAFNDIKNNYFLIDEEDLLKAMQM